MLTKNIAIQSLTSFDQLKSLVHASGPCVSIYVSSYSVGYSLSLFSTQLQAVMDTTVEQLKSQYPEKDPLSLPFSSVFDAVMLAYGERHRGSFAIFLSHDTVHVLWMANAVTDQIRLGDTFYIRPLISVLASIRDFCVLAISQKYVRLLRCIDAELRPIQLRSDLPQSIEQALAMDVPDHSLENRSASGSAENARRGIRFGTNTAEKKADSYMSRFFKIIDTEVNRLLHDAQVPVLLCAVDHEAAHYRRINTYPLLLEENIHGSPDWLSDAQIHEQALDALAREHAKATEKIAAEFLEKTSGSLLLQDAPAILTAASAGKVRDVLLAEQAADPWEEDILNQIVVQTIQKGGRVFSEPAELLPAGKTALAILRHNP